MSCVFCTKLVHETRLSETENFYAVFDQSPANPGHTLIISKKHYTNLFCIPLEEQKDLPEILDKVQKFLTSKFKPGGFTVGTNVGLLAGQSVFHFHIHIIPRYKGDCKNPHGGIRHAIVGKGYY